MARLHPNTSDIELVTSLKTGNQDALSILYDRYSGLVYTIALQILDRRDEAEDLTQDVFLTFWKQEKFDPQRGALSSYLAILTRSRALNKLDSRGSQQRAIARLQLTEDNEFSGRTPLEEATLQEQQMALRQAMNQLPPGPRQVLELSYFQGLSQSQIAQTLNLPLGTVKSQSRQALLKLRQLLGNAVG